MPLRKFVFRPGVNREGTNYSNEGGWFDSDKVRFRKGRPERIGGWRKNSPNSFTGTCRKIHVYRDIDQTNRGTARLCCRCILTPKNLWCWWTSGSGKGTRELP